MAARMRRLALASALLAVGAPARADDVEEFYRGKTVNIVVGYGPGGGYDLYARLLSRYIGNYIPGHPSVVVQNMPGAAGMRAANYLFTSAPKDGTFFGTFDMNVPLVGLLGGNANVQYDPRKFNWLGSLDNSQDDAYALWARRDAKVKTAADLMKPGGPELTIGVIGPGASDYDLAALLRDAFGFRFKIVAGYPNSAAIGLAIDNAEIESEFVSYVSSKIIHPKWAAPDGPVRVMMQFARATRHPDLPDAPTVLELARDDNQRHLIEVAQAPFRLARPYVAPPALPAERAKALQEAFKAAAADAGLVAEGRGMTLDVAPVFASEATELVDALANSPPETFAKLRALRDALTK